MTDPEPDPDRLKFDVNDEVTETLLGIDAAQRLDPVGRSRLGLVYRRQADAMSEVIRRVEASVADYKPPSSDDGIFAAQLASRLDVDPEDLREFARRRGDDKKRLRWALWMFVAAKGADLPDVVLHGARVLDLAESTVYRLIDEHDRTVGRQVARDLARDRPLRPRRSGDVHRAKRPQRIGPPRPSGETHRPFYPEHLDDWPPDEPRKKPPAN